MLSSLFDDNAATKWFSFFSAETTAPPWVELTFDSPRQINMYTVRAPLDHLERDPRNWTLSAWEDGGWVVIDKRQNEAFHARGMVRKFYTAITAAYTRYQFGFTSLRHPSVAEGVQISDITLYEGTCVDNGTNFLLNATLLTAVLL